jgi:hypothetical protein
MIDIKAVTLVGRDPAGRRVRLFQVASVLEVADDVSDRCGGEPLACKLGDRAGADRLALAICARIKWASISRLRSSSASVFVLRSIMGNFDSYCVADGVSDLRRHNGNRPN